uniref:V-set and immunoglobulin domain-containing protein 1-like n=1 Tax=Pristiophorus japonicus TaxID=55135 RepID=UPI00398E745F
MRCDIIHCPGIFITESEVQEDAGEKGCVLAVEVTVKYSQLNATEGGNVTLQCAYATTTDNLSKLSIEWTFLSNPSEDYIELKGRAAAHSAGPLVATTGAPGLRSTGPAAWHPKRSAGLHDGGLVNAWDAIFGPTQESADKIRMVAWCANGLPFKVRPRRRMTGSFMAREASVDMRLCQTRSPRGNSAHGAQRGQRGVIYYYSNDKLMFINQDFKGRLLAALPPESLAAPLADSTPGCCAGNGNVITVCSDPSSTRSENLIAPHEAAVDLGDAGDSFVGCMLGYARTGMLTISNISASEYDVYQCTASNILGNQSCTVDLSKLSSDSDYIIGAIIGAILVAMVIGAIVWVVTNKKKKNVEKDTELQVKQEARKTSSVYVAAPIDDGPAASANPNDAQLPEAGQNSLEASDVHEPLTEAPLLGENAVPSGTKKAANKATEGDGPQAI